MIYKDKLALYSGVVLPLIDAVNQIAAKCGAVDTDDLREKEPSTDSIQVALGVAMNLSCATLSKDGLTVRPPKSPKQKASKRKR